MDVFFRTLNHFINVVPNVVIIAIVSSTVVFFFFFSDCDVLHVKGSNSTPLHLAASGGHSEVVRVLLTAGANVTQMDKVHIVSILCFIFFVSQALFF